MPERRNPRSPAFALIVFVAIAGCGPTPSGPPAAGPSGATATPVATAAPTAAGQTSQNPGASPTREAGWRSDIAMLVPAMAAIHPGLSHSTSRSQLDAAAADLARLVDSATDDELMVGILRLVAQVSAAGCDAHTGAFVWGSGSYPVDSLPLRLWLFKREEGEGDAVVIVGALPPYERLIGATIDTVEGRPIADVRAALDSIIPRDNDQTVRSLTPRYLLIPQVLRGIGLPNDNSVRFRYSIAGESAEVDMASIPMADYNAWAGPYGLHLPADPGVRYLSRIGDALWWEVLDDGETLYVQHNRVDRLPADLVSELEAALAAPEITRVLLDIRHNFGGEVSALDAITPVLVRAARGEADRLFVLIGRNTFSAGSLLAARLQRDGHATLVGEATGGCPTIWSDPSDVHLPWSGITVSVAGDVAVGVDPDDPRLTLEPDLSAILGVDEWADGIDPALEQLDVDAP